MRKALIGLLVTACAAPLMATPAQPDLGARAKTIITVKGMRFKDLNANGRLDANEDWRLPAQKRAADLVPRMTLSEKAGMMLIATNNPDCGGKAKPQGRLPFALPRSVQSVLNQHPDAPGYAETKDGALFNFGHGLSY